MLLEIVMKICSIGQPKLGNILFTEWVDRVPLRLEDEHDSDVEVPAKTKGGHLVLAASPSFGRIWPVWDALLSRFYQNLTKNQAKLIQTLYKRMFSYVQQTSGWFWNQKKTCLLLHEKTCLTLYTFVYIPSKHFIENCGKLLKNEFPDVCIVISANS